MHKILCVCAVLLTASCVTKWSKPGATEAEFEGTKSACDGRSYSQFPPAPQQIMIMAGYVTPMQTQCYGSGYYVNCNTTGGQYIPPSYMTVDNNQRPRDAAVRSCFFEQGWTPDK
jgi:hypothetical protein